MSRDTRWGTYPVSGKQHSEKINERRLGGRKHLVLIHTLTAVHSHEHPIDLNCFSAINLNLEDESDKEPIGKRIHDRWHSHVWSLNSHICPERLCRASSRSSTPYSASPRRLAPPLEHLKMTANQPPSAASALADASTIDASIVEYYTDRTGRSSPSQRY